MALHLTKRHIEIAVGLIDGWSEKLTWNALCEELGALIGSRPARQTLYSHLRIKEAFTQKKEQLKNGSAKMRRPSSLNIAQQRIQRLESENQRLISENARLLDQFNRWQYNVYKRGITKDMLDAALPAIDRDSSEVKP